MKEFKVPERKPSQGEILNKNRTRTTHSPGTKAFDTFIESKFKGASQVRVKSNLPHPFKCSKCAYVATSAKDSKQHWFDEH